MVISRKFSSFKEIIQAMGLVFGDIGTSPIYTLTVVYTLTPPTYENIIGILSLIFWTLVMLVTVEYAWLAMSLSIKGEGGIIVLKEILTSSVKTGRKAAFATFLGFVGVSLLMGDGVITPAISILSAVEGLELIPGIGHISITTVIIITCIITIFLFLFQYKGSDKVSFTFGPIMLIWFSVLLITGLYYIFESVDVIKAISPYYAVNFMLKNGITGILVLSEVILCATGGEALYADMGHLGSKPIRHAWYFVFFALVINYFGQGAFLIKHHVNNIVLFSMFKSISEVLYIPMLILTLLATIIASQAMISAVMSLIYQGITTRVFPLMKIKYTSAQLKSQIYIGSVNWILMIAVIFMVLVFQKSGNLAAAYGFAVTATMTISATFMIWIFKIKKNKAKMLIAVIVSMVDFLFLIAVFNKLPHGGYWSIIIAAIPFIVIQLWTNGGNAMHKSFRPLAIDIFNESYNQIYQQGNVLKGTALYFTRSLEEVPPYIVHCMIRCNIIYEKNILISIRTTDSPYGIEFNQIDNIAQGLSGIQILAGYQEIVHITQLLKEHGVDEKVIFYGVDDITTNKVLLKLYAFMKTITPAFVRFYDLPYNKLHGVVTRLEL
ncbi:MAG: KUP/HAK/KT family potassium transporter [Bacteroidetes bacterium]|nr:KUP/HAK/KT family potassium transporter [Bacteroidota bacterium]